MSGHMYTDGSHTYSTLQEAVMQGEAYRVSARRTLAAGEEFIVYINPVEAGGTIHIEPPSVLPEGVADIDVYENPDPQGNLVDDLEVHNTAS